MHHDMPKLRCAEYVMFSKLQKFDTADNKHFTVGNLAPKL